MTTGEVLPLAGGEQLSDEEVVRRVVAGETPLFEIIVRRYNQRIYRALRAILRNEQEIEDAMQQAYVNAFEHLHQFADRARFSTWLTRIAINEALGRLRKQDRRFTVVGEEDSDGKSGERRARSGGAGSRVAVAGGDGARGR